MSIHLSHKCHHFTSAHAVAAWILYIELRWLYLFFDDLIESIVLARNILGHLVLRIPKGIGY